MASGGEEDVDEKPIGELFGRLIDEGKAYAKAELGLARATAEAKAAAARKPVLLAAAALLLLIGGVVVLCITLAIALAIPFGPLPGTLLATLITFAVAFGLFLWARQEARKLND